MPEFMEKLLIWKAQYTFLESRQPQDTKNSCNGLPQLEAEKSYKLLDHLRLDHR